MNGGEMDYFQALRDLREPLPKAMEALHYGDVMKGAIEEASALAQSFKHLEKVLENLEKIEGELVDSERLALKNELSSLQEKGRQFSEVEGVSELRHLGHRCLQIKGDCEKFEGVVNRAWQRVLQHWFATEKKLAGIFSRIEELREVGTSLERCARQGLGFVERFPLEAGELETLLECYQQVEANKEKLKQSDVDDELRGFLLAVVEGKATLSFLSEKVLRWLKEQEALDSFSVLAK